MTFMLDSDGTFVPLTYHPGQIAVEPDLICRRGTSMGPPPSPEKIGCSNAGIGDCRQ
jgi:hypothetical protein